MFWFDLACCCCVVLCVVVANLRAWFARGLLFVNAFPLSALSSLICACWLQIPLCGLCVLVRVDVFVCFVLSPLRCNWWLGMCLRGLCVAFGLSMCLVDSSC